MKLEELINKNYRQLNENDLYIWNYINHHKKECEHLSIDELALRCNVSRSTILRFSKRLGLKGYAEFKVFLRINNQSDSDSLIVNNIYNGYIEMIQQFEGYRYHDIARCIYEAKNLFVYGTGLIQENTAQYLKRSFSMVNKLFLDIDCLADFEGYINLDYSLHVRTMPIITNMGRREYLVGIYFVLVDFILANYIEYVNNRGEK